MALDSIPSPPPPASAGSPSVRGSLLAPPELRRRLILAGPTLAVAAFVAAWARPGTPLFWVLVGAAVAVVAVATRTRASDRACAFCGAGGEQVSFLVTGPAVSLCAGCAAAASAKSAEELDRQGLHVEWLQAFLGGLSERAPLALSRPHLERLAWTDPAPEALRASAAWCARLGHHALARELLETLPEADRTALDWSDLAAALGAEGRLGDALAAARRAADGTPAGAWSIAQAAWLELQLHPGAPAEDLARWLEQVVEARRQLQDAVGDAGDAGLEDRVASCWTVEAELRRRTGDGEGALRCLDEAAARVGPDGERLLVRARTLAALGRAAEARGEAERAVALLRPDAQAAEDARRLLDELAAAPAAPGAVAHR